MIFLDLHAHSSGISKCCKITGEQAVDESKAVGLDGIVLTNHYASGYVGGEKYPTYEDFAEAYLAEYRRIKAYGDSVGFRVFFGVEVSAGWNASIHLLAYGVDESFVTDHPRMCEYSLDQLYETVHAYGGILVQAHPYRRNDCLQDLNYLDGVEISCHPHLHYGGSHADAMKKIAEENGKILTCGGDYHGDVTYRPRCGAYLPETVTDGVSLGKYLAEAKTLTMTVHEPGGEVFSVEYERQEEH